MKCYKAYLKEEFLDRWDKIDISSPIFITEEELDYLIDGQSIIKESNSEKYKVYYKDLEMITTCD